jgi:hypothetical protein
MEESKRKPIMIGVIVVCLVLAAIIWQKTRRGEGASIEDIPAGAMIWLKCENCGEAYQIPKREYYEYMQEHQDPFSPGPLYLVCKECGQEKARRAVKCAECGEVFFYGTAPAGDFADRCPKCGYSEMEAKREEALEGR